VQVDHVIGVPVGDDHGIDTLAAGRTQQAQQPGQGSIAQVQHDPESLVLQHETAASPAALRPGPAATKNDQATGHALTVPA